MVSPSAPKRGGEAPRLEGGAVDLSGIFADREKEMVGGGFALRLV